MQIPGKPAAPDPFNMDPEATGEYPVGVVEAILSTIPAPPDSGEDVCIPGPAPLPTDLDILYARGDVVIDDDDGEY